jgi:hypothetical protein
MRWLCADEERGQPPEFEVELDRGRPQKIAEDKSLKVIKTGPAEEGPAEPYNCTTNPAPWWHQITVRSAYIIPFCMPLRAVCSLHNVLRLR